jgi:Flp pilus assembly protein TadD
MDRGEAEAAFRRLAKQTPDDDRYSYGLALALLQLDRQDEARTWLKNALATNPRLERSRKKLAESTQTRKVRTNPTTAPDR